MAETTGERLDAFLARAAGVSRESVKRAIGEGRVQIGGETTDRPGRRLRQGEEIILTLPPAPPSRALPEGIPLQVVFEDDAILVIDKPAGMVVHPAAGHPSGTLVNAVLGRVGNLPGPEPFRPGIVHRLDKDTSGLLVVAKTSDARERLMAQLRSRAVSRRYLALATRTPDPEAGTVDRPIGRDPRNRLRMAVTPGGRPAVTHYRTVRRFATGRALLDVRLRTGRTHQIRVHMASMGAPLVGDRTYGGGVGPRQALHAYGLSLVHPVSGHRMAFRSGLPEDLRKLLRFEDPTLDVDGLIGDLWGQDTCPDGPWKE